MAEILIIKLSALGDLVQADGAIRDIREHHQDDNLTVMTIPSYQSYMERCPWVDEVFVDPRASRFNPVQMLKLRRRLRLRRFSKIYDLQQVGRTSFYRRFLFPKTWWLGDAPGCSVYLKRPDHQCAADHFQAHLDKAGINTSYCLAADVSWMADPIKHLLDAHGVEPGYVLLIPGASSAHDTKRWPYFEQLARSLRKYGREPVVVPGPAEMEYCRKLPGTSLVSDGGYLDYFALAGVARQAAYVVGNDTGPTHIAAHLGCRGLALYGPHTPPLTTGIQHSRLRWLESDNLGDLTFDQVWSVVARDLGLG